MVLNMAEDPVLVVACSANVDDVDAVAFLDIQIPTIGGMREGVVHNEWLME